VGEFTEVESGKRSDRPELAKALAMCRLHGARLVIAKLDRLSRNAHFLFGLQEAGVDFVAADMPNANQLTVGIMAMVAQDEAKRISERTKAALAAAKKRGTKLGGFRGFVPAARMRKLSAEALWERTEARAELQAAGKTSLRAIAAGLNDAGIPTARGGEWSSPQVMRIFGAPFARRSRSGGGVNGDEMGKTGIGSRASLPTRPIAATAIKPMLKNKGQRR
jgi:DNA invertase Pin-like site-specific DNA recombinase